MNITKRVGLLALCTALVSAGMVTSAAAQQTTNAFDAGAYAIQGSVTYTPVGTLLPQTVTLGAVDASNTNGSGSSDDTLASSQNTAFGIQIYNLADANDSTSACDSGSCDDGNADASVSGINLLGGLVTVSTLNAPLLMAPNASNPSLIHLSGQSSIGGLGGTGINVPAGTYPAETAFPINGNIQVPSLNLLGIQIGTQQEPFTGTLTLDDVLSMNDSAGNLIGEDVVAAHVTGSTPDGLGGSYNFVPASRRTFIILH